MNVRAIDLVILIGSVDVLRYAKAETKDEFEKSFEEDCDVVAGCIEDLLDTWFGGADTIRKLLKAREDSDDVRSHR